VPKIPDDGSEENYHDLLAIINDCLNMQVTQWEEDFLNNIKQWLIRTKSLTPKQFDILLKIENRVTR
jgi:hypothetical protein